LLEQLIRHSRPPEDGNHMPKHVGVEIWNVLIKVHYFLERLLVFLQTVLQDGRFSHQEIRSLVFGTRVCHNIATCFIRLVHSKKNYQHGDDAECLRYFQKM
jgi:hypothetical protein